MSSTQLENKNLSKQIKDLLTHIDKLRTQITGLEGNNAELRERITNTGDREKFELQIRDLQRELERRNKIIAELRSK